jgi:hypothetical protein
VVEVQTVRKNKRKLTRKVSRPRTRFNDRLKLPGWPGKDGTAAILARCGLLCRQGMRK